MHEIYLSTKCTFLGAAISYVHTLHTHPIMVYWVQFRGDPMKTSVISQPHFCNEEAAYSYVEACLWPEGPVCPHCGATERAGQMKGRTTRMGLYKCYACRKPFTVKIGTIFEDSHIPMHKWVQAIYLISASKKVISSNRLHQALGITLKSAGFLGLRIREAMRRGDLDSFGSHGGERCV